MSGRRKCRGRQRQPGALSNTPGSKRPAVPRQMPHPARTRLASAVSASRRPAPEHGCCSGRLPCFAAVFLFPGTRTLGSARNGSPQCAGTARDEECTQLTTPPSRVAHVAPPTLHSPCSRSRSSTGVHAPETRLDAFTPPSQPKVAVIDPTARGGASLPRVGGLAPGDRLLARGCGALIRPPAH